MFEQAKRDVANNIVCTFEITFLVQVKQERTK